MMSDAEKSLEQIAPLEKSVGDAMRELNDRRIKGMIDAMNATQNEFNAMFVPVVVITPEGIISRIEVRLK